jgi:SAM-dependent methyltransferase
MRASTAYDDMPYRSLPIEWSAPERLALASLLHGGPRAPRRGYRVLELGCGDGANLLALAYYRRDAEFVGVDFATSQIEAAHRRRAALGLTNVDFIAVDFREADEHLAGRFDYILAHGVFSWVSAPCRAALLDLFATRLQVGGLVYVNYNAFPGWKLRGMVRDYLLAATSGCEPLAKRAQAAQAAAQHVLDSMAPGTHAYSALIANEFRMVCEGHRSYVAHEYLAPENQAFWSSEFLGLARAYGLDVVAEADFSYASGRVPAELPAQLQAAQLGARSIDDTVDLLCFRQLHSPILTVQPLHRRPLEAEEFEDLIVASCLERRIEPDAACARYVHPSGYEVEVKEAQVGSAFELMRGRWPQGLRIGDLFDDPTHVAEDLLLMHRHGLIELRTVEAGEGVDARMLQCVECSAGGYHTSRFHTVEWVAS